MKLILKTTVACALAGLFGSRAHAAGLEIKVDIPRIDVAEYHRPYVAIWLESPDRKTVRDLAVWYDHDMARDEGKKWLKDLRQWWRISGRRQDSVADGVSGATQPVGTHALRLDAQDERLAGLAPGEYELVVEAAREKGGRELLRLPLAWPPEAGKAVKAQGESELGLVQATPIQ